MARFSPTDRAEFLTIKSLCYCGLSHSELLARLGTRLSRHLRADAFCMVQLDPNTNLPIFAVGDGWPEEAHGLLIEQALLASPTADPGRLIERRQRTVNSDDLVPPDRPFYCDPYFEYHILWGGYRYETQTPCALGKRGQAHLTVSRKSSTGSFEARHARLLDALAPHVAAGMHAASIRESLSAAGGGDTGVIVLDGNGKVAMANGAGERWLSRVDVMGRSGYMWAVHVVARVLSRNVDEDAAADVPVLEMNDPATGTLYRLRAEHTTDAGGAPCTVVLIEPVRRIDRPQTLMRFGLTQREAEVTLGLLRGASEERLAQEVGVSIHTVVHHRRSAFEKLDVSSRRELLARVYGGF